MRSRRPEVAARRSASVAHRVDSAREDHRPRLGYRLDQLLVSGVKRQRAKNVGQVVHLDTIDQLGT